MERPDFFSLKNGSKSKLPFSKKRALVETTWISELNNDKLCDYEQQIDDYLSKHLNIRNCKVNYKELGAIPLFRTKKIKKQRTNGKGNKRNN